MRGVHYYYSEFQRELNDFDPSAGQEFAVLSSTHSPREIFLWLEQRRVNGLLPSTLERLLTDFYWEIS